MATDKQLLRQRGDDCAATNGKQQSTNAQRGASYNGRMRWRTTAAEVMWQMEQRTSNYGWWQKGIDSADDNNDIKKTINKCVMAEAEDDDGLQEVGHGGGGRGATVVQRQRRNSFAMRSWRMEVEDRWVGMCSYGGKSTLNLTLEIGGPYNLPVMLITSKKKLQVPRHSHSSPPECAPVLIANFIPPPSILNAPSYNPCAQYCPLAMHRNL
jgi:hypothetical protein